MSKCRTAFRFGSLLVVLWLVAHSSSAQSLFVGAKLEAFQILVPGGPAPLAGVETYLQTGYGATLDGSVNVATFVWSEAPCPAAVKIKFFRPLNDRLEGEFIYLGERGPFDVTVTQQSVLLDPAVPLHAGDLIAITNVTSCGGPVTAVQVVHTDVIPIPPYYAVPGDIVTNIVPATPVPTSGPGLFVFAVDQSMKFLRDRFRITLLATDPRNGAVTVGYPVTLGDSSGYFSLPDFTYDSAFPEVVVKMVDATNVPALGGDFWFFHAPLTDSQYTITLTDQTNGRVRTYTNSSGRPGQLCGAADTSAFPGP